MRAPRTAGVLVVVLLVPMLVGASGSEGRLQLSTDGRTWSSSLDAELFDPGVRWVPGDTRTATFHVRNASEATADVGIRIVGDDPSRLLDDLVVRARLGDGTWRRLGADAPVSLVADLAGRTDERVDVRVDFPATSANATRRRSAGLDLTVRLTQAGVGGAGGADDRAAGLLPGTGATVTLVVLLLALVAVLAGLTLLRRPSPSEQEEGAR